MRSYHRHNMFIGKIIKMTEKLPPYQRLKALVNDNTELTENGSKNLDSILGIETKPSIIERIRSLFNKIDSFIFAKSKITNRYHRRK
jgi:hypothetical protein